MPVMTTAPAPSFLPYGRPLTREDLDAMPDDGHRYELIDGLLIVTPAPSLRHQDAVLNLAIALKSAAPEPLKVLVAPFDVALAGDTVMQPDVLLAPRADFTAKNLPTAPLLAVEVLSPSTRGYDLLLKKERMQRAGCAHYWVVDPQEPSITAWSLSNDAYVETAHAAGDETFEVQEPLRVGFTPASLVG